MTYGTVRKMQLTKKILFSIIIIFIFSFILFIFSEILARIFIGDRLIERLTEENVSIFKNNQKGWYLSNAAHARINNIGARGEDFYIDQLNKNNKYIFLGDSFTFGWLLEDSETIPEYFRKFSNLSSSEVLNFGVGGFGIDHMMKLYEIKNDYISPGDEIIIIIIEDDFYRIIGTPTKVHLKAIFWKIRDYSAFVSIIWDSIYRIRAQSAVNIPRIYDDETLKKGLEKLSTFNDKIKNNGQEATFIFYEFNQTQYSNTANKYCNEKNMTCIGDIYNVFAQDKLINKKLYASDMAHPSALANLNVAKYIINFINQK